MYQMKYATFLLLMASLLLSPPQGYVFGRIGWLVCLSLGLLKK